MGDGEHEKTFTAICLWPMAKILDLILMKKQDVYAGVGAVLRKLDVMGKKCAFYCIWM